MVRGTISRRQALTSGLRVLAGAGSLVLLGTACTHSRRPPPPTAGAAPTQQAPAQAKPTTAPATSAPATTAPAAQPAAKPAAQPTVAPTAAPCRCRDAGRHAEARRHAPRRHPERLRHDVPVPSPPARPRTSASTGWSAGGRAPTASGGRSQGLAESWELGDKAAILKLRQRRQVPRRLGPERRRRRLEHQTWMQHPKSLAKTYLPGIDADNPCRGGGRLHRQDQPEGTVRLVAGRRSRTAPQTTGISSKAAHQKLGDDGMNLQAVGTGPFIFEAWQSGAQFSVNKNPNYWDKGLDGQPLPYLDKIIYRFVPDDSVRLNELRSGNADFTELIRGRDVPAAQADSNLVLLRGPSRNGNRYRFFFNAQKPRLQGQPEAAAGDPVRHRPRGDGQGARRRHRRGPNYDLTARRPRLRRRRSRTTATTWTRRRR